MAKRIRTADVREWQKAFNNAGFDFSVSANEIQQTIDDPPTKPQFPTALLAAVTIFEVLDIVVAAAGDGAVAGGFLYRIFRILTTLYLYTWAWSRIHRSIKFIGGQRSLLQGGKGVAGYGIKKLAGIAALSNLPLPIIGAILGALPMDAVFVIMVHNSHSKFVQNVWATLNLLSNTKVYGRANVTRQKRTGPTKVETSAHTETNKKTTSTIPFQKASNTAKEDNLDLRNAA